MIRKAVREFESLPHRLQFVGEFEGISFYDDAISTTPESTIAALEALTAGGKKVSTILLGGQTRGYDFSQLAKILVETRVKNIVLFPESGEEILSALQETPGGDSLSILRTSVMKSAVEFAYRNTEKGTICLLSTASPSYSLWKDFNEKGDEFRRSVRSYLA